MGAQHTSQFTRALQAEARGKFYVTQVIRDFERPDQHPYRRYALINRGSVGTEVAAMSAQTLPGCCGILLLHNFSGSDRDINAFIGMAVKAAARVGYGLVLLSVTAAHEAVAQGIGPQYAVEFTNPKTGNVVRVVSIQTGAQRQQGRAPIND